MTNSQAKERNGAPLTERLQTSIANHLNEDHLDDLLLCAKANADVDWAEQAKVIGLNAVGIDLEVRGGNHVQSLHLAFPESAQGVLALKRILENMIVESRDRYSH